jgi:rubrerythrin
MADKPTPARQGEWKALQASFRREKNGRNLYRKWATETQNQVAKLTFERLARRQERFLGVIQRVILTVQGKSDCPYQKVQLPILQPVETVVEKVLQGASCSSRQEIGVVHGDTLRAYLWAFEFEEKGVEMYARLVQRAEQKSVVELFAFMQKRKGEHYRILDQTLAFVPSPEVSFERMTDCPIGR